MKPLSLKVQYKGQSTWTENDAIPTAERALSSIVDCINAGQLNTLYIHPQVSSEHLTKLINDHFGDGVEARDGVSGGCYGARDGQEYKGLTLYIDATLCPDRFLDDDGDEVVNIAKLIEAFGGELVEGLDGDTFESIAEDLGHTVGRDNTYNYAGHDSDTPHFLFDSDFAIVGTENDDAPYFLSIKFHCGGDVRGNYTSKVVYKFSSMDDVYSVVRPSCELKGGSNE